MRLLAVVLVLATLAACKRGARPVPEPERTAPPPAAPGDRPYREATEQERRRLDELLARIPAATPDEIVEIDRRIVRMGPCAVPGLLAALRHEDARVRGQAAYLLGVLEDRRTVPALVAAASDPAPSVSYEACAALLELGDERGLDGLIEGLLDPDARLRSKCAAVLEQRTGRRFGYAADDPPDERAAAVRRWRSWREMRRAEEAARTEPEGMR